jgi:hypothetical protein
MKDIPTPLYYLIVAFAALGIAILASAIATVGVVLWVMFA